MAFAANSLRPIGRNAVSGNIIWSYHTTADTLETIFTFPYFDLTDHSGALNDLILIQATDGCSMATVSAINGSDQVTLGIFNQYTFPTADDVSVDNTSIDAGGAPSFVDNVQEAIEYLVERINTKIAGVVNVGSGSSFFAGTDDTDPTAEQIEIRRIAGDNGQEHINVFQSGDSLVVAAQTTLLRDGGSSTTGTSLVRTANAAGTLDLRGLTSDTGTIDIANEGVDVDINVASGSITDNELDSDVNTDIATGLAKQNALSNNGGSGFVMLNGTNVRRVVSGTDVTLTLDGSDNVTVSLSAGAQADIATGLAKQDAISNNGGSGLVLLSSGDLRRLVAGTGIDLTVDGSGNIEIALN